MNGIERTRFDSRLTTKSFDSIKSRKDSIISEASSSGFQISDDLENCYVELNDEQEINRSELFLSMKRGAFVGGMIGLTGSYLISNIVCCQSMDEGNCHEKDMLALKLIASFMTASTTIGFAVNAARHYYQIYNSNS